MNDKEKYFVRENRCPYCDYKTDSAGTLKDEAKPSSGDMSVCINCTEVSKFDPNLKLIKVDVSALDIKTLGDVQAVQEQVMKLRQHLNR